MMARWGMLACTIAGGVLWALSPLGVHLSELRFHTSNVFWKLFPSAPLLLLAGLIALYFIFFGRSGWLKRVGLVVFAAGSILFGVAAGRDRTLPVWATAGLGHTAVRHWCA